MKGTVIAVGVGMAGFLGFAVLSAELHPAPAQQPYDAATNDARQGYTPTPEDIAAGSPDRRFTKGEFDRAVYGRTKASIRSQFGKPDLVFDDSDTWVYNSPQVYDADAGTQVNAAEIRFEGIQGAEDHAAAVSYR